MSTFKQLPTETQAALWRLARYLDQVFPNQAVVFFDSEFTDDVKRGGRALELGLYRFYQGKVEDWQMLLNPQTKIPKKIIELTSITKEMVQRRPKFAEIFRTLQLKLKDSILVAHGAESDYEVLRVEFALCGQSFKSSALCTLRLSQLLYPNEKNHKLSDLIQRFKLPISQQHRALVDALATALFVDQAIAEHGLERVVEAMRQSLNPILMPEHCSETLRQNVSNDIPETFGLTYWYDENQVLMQVNAHQMAYRETLVLLRDAKKLPEKITFRSTAGMFHAYRLKALHDWEHQEKRALVVYPEHELHHAVYIEEIDGCLKARIQRWHYGYHAKVPNGYFTSYEEACNSLLLWCERFGIQAEYLFLNQFNQNQLDGVVLSNPPSASALQTHNENVRNAMMYMSVRNWSVQKNAPIEVYERNREEHQYTLCHKGLIFLRNKQGEKMWFCDVNTELLFKKMFRNHTPERPAYRIVEEN